MNPLETIENSSMLSAIFKGLTEMWHHPEQFLGMVIYFTQDFDTGNRVVELYSEDKLDLEEALFEAMPLREFKERCVNSEYLDIDKCNKLVEKCNE